MFKRALFLAGTCAALVTVEHAKATSPLELWTDIDQTAYLRNTTAMPLSLTGYQINSPDLDLDPTAWRSISDWLAVDPSAALTKLGGSASGFQELLASSARISEENPVGIATPLPGARFSIGRPFRGPLSYQQAWANYTVPGSSERLYLEFSILPEPSAWLLASLAGTGLVAMRRRRRPLVAFVARTRGLARNLLRVAVAVWLIAAFAGGAANAAAVDLQLWGDVDGTVYLVNTTDYPISFDGYQIVSEEGLLDPAGWDSISDRIPARINELIAQLGAGSLTFGEANPTAFGLAELNLPNVAILPAHGRFSLGKPFQTVVNGLCFEGFFWSAPGTGSQQSGGGLQCPEPSTWLLAALAGLGLLAMHRRSRQ